MTITDLVPRGTQEDHALLHYVDLDGHSHAATVDQAGDVPFEHAQLVRPIQNWKGQRNFTGLYWSSTTRRHIEFESHLESCWLTIFDFDPTVIDMAAQPFRLVGRVAGSLIDHVPDFFLRRLDGTGVVVDVRAEGLQDAAFQVQTAATRSICKNAGFEYDVVSEPDQQWWENVRFLAGYRRAPAIGLDYGERLVGLAGQPVRFQDLASFVDDPSISRVVVLHLCWTQDLVFDLHQPLTDATLLQSREAFP